jgi:hypothetical protein
MVFVRGKFHEKLVKINENSIFIFHFASLRGVVVDLSGSRVQDPISTINIHEGGH